jgi:Photosynthetic reaction centre cytochrome C subunit
MRKLLSASVVVGAVALASAIVVAQGPPPGPPAPGRQGGGRGPAGPTNLKVLPKTWTRQQVSAVMSTFAESLGVQCSHCHAEDPNAPPPAPGQNPRLDYALDTKKEKDVARDMIKMVMSINDSTKALGDGTDAEKVSCFTCHHGDKQPAKTPENGWGRGSFTLSEAGPVVPQRGGRGPGGPPPGGAPPAGAPQ